MKIGDKVKCKETGKIGTISRLIDDNVMVEVRFQFEKRSRCEIFFKTELELLENSKKEEVGTKHDNGKPRMTLLDQDFVDAVLKVLEHGAKTHGERNWELVDAQRYINAAYRHLGKLRSGEITDTDANGALEHHAAYLACNAYFLYKLLEDTNEK
jgi:hypothetical protein